ncbi:MAG: ABC transporter ATP-binding protein [Oscillospiraceae bacterium]
MIDIKEPIIQCKALSFWYDKNTAPVMNKVDMQVYENEALMLMGPSGSGKSTLAYCAAGLYPEYAGQIEGCFTTQDGEDIAALTPNKRAGWVSMMFQNPDDQFCMDTVENEIAFALENIGYAEDFKPRIQELLGLVGLQGLQSSQLATLSGGTKQKVALASALAAKPGLLVLDEPFANIDPQAAHEIAAKLKLLAKELAFSLLIVDHRLDYWADIATRILILGKDGKWEEEGLAVSDLQTKQKRLDRLGLFGTEISYPHFSKNTAMYFENKVPAATAKNLCAGYGKSKVLQALNFTIEAGSITAVMGPNGSGKTTLLWALAGLIKHKGDLHTAAPVGVVFQNPGYQFLTLNVLDEIVYTLRTAKPGMRDEEYTQKARQFLAEFGLEEQAKKSPYMLSQGQQRRLAVLTMLAGQQKLLLLDEPTYAQDKKGTLFIMERLIKRVYGEGLTAVIATHDPYLARAYAHRILYMQQGAIVGEERKEGDAWIS